MREKNGKIFEEITSENLTLMENSQYIKEILCTPSRINTKRSTSRLIVKLLKLKAKRTS